MPSKNYSNTCMHFKLRLKWNKNLIKVSSKLIFIMKNDLIKKKKKKETKGNKDKLFFYHFMHHGNENIKQHTGKKIN